MLAVLLVLKLVELLMLEFEVVMVENFYYKLEVKLLLGMSLVLIEV